MQEVGQKMLPLKFRHLERKNWMVWLLKDGSVHCTELIDDNEQHWDLYSLSGVAVITCIHKEDALKHAKEYFIERLIENEFDM